ncbi:hypothetical protein MASR1M36_08220 [Candidatus Cloacimonadaceae bacterium]
MKALVWLCLLLLLTTCLVVACKQSTFTEYTIDRSSCNGCGECSRVCPNDAIYYDTLGKAVIDQSRCSKCAKCVAVCPNSAIY